MRLNFIAKWAIDHRGAIGAAEYIEEPLTTVSEGQAHDLMARSAKRLGDSRGQLARGRRALELVGCNDDTHRVSRAARTGNRVFRRSGDPQPKPPGVEATRS